MNRTKKGWKEYCIEHLKNHDRMFTIWWATENKFISNAMDRLVKSKKIKVTPLHFPISKVRISKINMQFRSLT